MVVQLRDRWCETLKLLICCWLVWKWNGVAVNQEGSSHCWWIVGLNPPCLQSWSVGKVWQRISELFVSFPSLSQSSTGSTGPFQLYLVFIYTGMCMEENCVMSKQTCWVLKTSLINSQYAGLVISLIFVVFSNVRQNKCFFSAIIVLLFTF